MKNCKGSGRNEMSELPKHKHTSLLITFAALTWSSGETRNYEAACGVKECVTVCPFSPLHQGGGSWGRGSTRLGVGSIWF